MKESPLYIVYDQPCMHFCITLLHLVINYFRCFRLHLKLNLNVRSGKSYIHELLEFDYIENKY